MPAAGEPKRKRFGPGMVHFDVTQGCSAELLNGAMADLGLSLDPSAQALRALGMTYVQPLKRSESAGRVFGVSVDFVHDSGASLLSKEPSGPRSHRYEAAARKHSPRWHRAQPASDEHKPADNEAPKVTNEFDAHRQEVSTLDQWLRGKKVSFEDMLSQVKMAELAPIPSALAQKTLGFLANTLQQAHGSEAAPVLLEGQRAVRILCDVVTFATLLTQLDPLEVTSTRVPLSWPLHTHEDDPIDERGWVLALSEDLPVYEQEWPAPYSDVVGLALLKCAVSHFGVRGESRLLQTGVGVSKSFGEPKLLARALWCEPTQIATRTVEGQAANPKVAPLVQIKGIIGHGVDAQELIRRVSSLGGRSIVTEQKLELGVYPKTCLSIVSPYFDVEKIIEALLVTGECTEISTSFIEQHALAKRTVAVPFGRGQKQQQCRVIEWLWGERVLRAEPLAADLSALVAATGYAQEVLRGDVLMSWKKWRGFE
jgi:hypothetical protein